MSDFPLYFVKYYHFEKLLNKLVVGINAVQHSKIKKIKLISIYIADSSVDNRSEAPRCSTAGLYPYGYYRRYVLPDLS